MGKKDIGLKAYFQNTERYADLWNGAVFQGRQVVKADDLKEITPVYSKADQVAVFEKTGDLVMKQSHGGQQFVVFALENQEVIDYGMPVRIMLQEALEYDRQIREIQRENRRIYKELYEGYKHPKEALFYKDSGEYLYKIRREDYLCPIMTLVVYWGEKKWHGAKSLHEMINFGSMDFDMREEVKKMIPEYPLHFMSISDFEHFEYFKTEIRPLLELLQRRSHKDAFKNYLQNEISCQMMDEESWYLLGQMTDCKLIKSVIAQKNREGRSGESMCNALDEWLNDERTAGRAEGKAEGRAEGRAEGKAEFILVILKEHGTVPKKLESAILGQTDIEVLDAWFRLAIHTKDIDEFASKIQLEK